LDRGVFPVYLDDLADEALVADADDFVHLGADHSLGNDDGACDPGDLSRLEVRHET